MWGIPESRTGAVTNKAKYHCFSINGRMSLCGRYKECECNTLFKLTDIQLKAEFSNGRVCKKCYETYNK